MKEWRSRYILLEEDSVLVLEAIPYLLGDLRMFRV